MDFLEFGVCSLWRVVLISGTACSKVELMSMEIVAPNPLARDEAGCVVKMALQVISLYGT